MYPPKSYSLLFFDVFDTSLVNEGHRKSLSWKSIALVCYVLLLVSIAGFSSAFGAGGSPDKNSMNQPKTFN